MKSQGVCLEPVNFIFVKNRMDSRLAQVLDILYTSAMDDTDPIRVSKAMEIYQTSSLTLKQKIEQITAILQR